MSLLADLLSKIKQPQKKIEVPPNLKDIVKSSSKKSSDKKKLIILVSLVIIAVTSGFFLIHLVNDLSRISVSKPDKATASIVAESNSIQHKTTDTDNDRPHTTVAIKDAPVPPLSVSAVTKQEEPDRDVKNIDTKKTVSVKEKKKPTSAGTASPIKAKPDTAEMDSLLYIARAFEIKKDYTGALENYRKVLVINKDNYTVMNNIAYILLKLGVVEKSIKYSRDSLRINGNYVPALINLGIAQAKSGDAASAENTFKKAGALAPENRSALLNLAVLNERQGDYKSASMNFSRLIKLGDESGYIGLARVYEKQNRTGEALKLYKKISLLESLDKNTLRLAKQKILLLKNLNRQLKRNK